MIVKYDEENFSIKLYRNFAKGKLVGLMEVIPIDKLLEVWADRKTEPLTTNYCDTCDHKKCEYCVADGSNPYCVPSNYHKVEDEPQTEYKKWETPPKFEHKGIVTTCVGMPVALSEYIKKEDAIEAVTSIFRVSALFSGMSDNEEEWREKAEKVLAKCEVVDIVDTSQIERSE